MHRCFTTISGHGAFVEHIEFSPAGDQLVTASHDGTARLWDIDGILTTTLLHRNRPTFAVFSPNGSYLATGGGDQIVHLWHVASGREFAEFDTQGSGIRTVGFSPDGGRVATASDGEIQIWDVESRRRLARLKTDGGFPTDVRFSPDGAFLESASVHGRAQIWNSAGGAEGTVIRTSVYMPSALFSPNSHLLLIANDNIVRALKADGTSVAVFAGHHDRIRAAAFSPDGELFVTGSADRTARIWSLKKASTVAILSGHNDAVTGGSVCPRWKFNHNRFPRWDQSDLEYF